MNQSKTIISYFFIYVLICLMSTFFRAWFPAITQTQWLLIAAVGLSVFVNGNFYGSKTFICFAIFIAVLLVNWRTGDSHFREFSICFYEFMVPLFAMNLFLTLDKSDNGHLFKVLFAVFTIMIGIVAIGTVFVEQGMPEVVRSLSNSGDDIESLNMYFRMGVSNYTLPHALPALIPIFVYALKSNDKFSVIWFFYLVTLLFCIILIIYSGATSALLLGIIALTLSLMTGLDGISKPKIILVSALFLPFILSNALMNGVLQFLIDIFNGNSSFDSFTQHLMDMSYSLMNETGAEGDVEARVDRYQNTFDVIINNLILGTNGSAGGHMALLERLAQLGLIGFIPLIMTYTSYFKSISIKVNNSVKPFFIESLVIAFMMMTLKNMINNEMNIVLFAMIPLYSVYFTKSNA